MPSIINNTSVNPHNQPQAPTADRDPLPEWRLRRWSYDSMPDPGPRTGIDLSPYTPLSSRQWEPVPPPPFINRIISHVRSRLSPTSRPFVPLPPSVNRIASHSHSRLSPLSRPFVPQRPTSSTMLPSRRTVIENEIDLPGNMNLNVQLDIPNETLPLLEGTDSAVPLRPSPSGQIQAMGPLPCPALGHWDSLWRYNVALLYPIHPAPQWTPSGFYSMFDWRFHRLAEMVVARMGRFAPNADFDYELLDPLEWINIMVVPSYGEDNDVPSCDIDVGLLWVRATNAGWRVMTLSTFEQHVMLCDEHAQKLYSLNLPLPRSGLPVVEPYLGMIESFISSHVEEPSALPYQSIISAERINRSIPIVRPEVESPAEIPLDDSTSLTDARPSYGSQITESPTLAYRTPETPPSKMGEVGSITSLSPSDSIPMFTPDVLSVANKRVEGGRSAPPVLSVSSSHTAQPPKGAHTPPGSISTSPLSPVISEIEATIERPTRPSGQRTEDPQSPSERPLSFSAGFWSALDKANSAAAIKASSGEGHSRQALPPLRSREMVLNQVQIVPIINACHQLLNKHWHDTPIRVAEGIVALLVRTRSTNEQTLAFKPFWSLSKHDWIPIIRALKGIITRRSTIFTEKNIRGESRLIIGFISEQLDAALKRPATISEAKKFVVELDKLPNDRRAGKCVKAFEENVPVFLALHAGYLFEDPVSR